jgi:PAS domain S-box-containing protein
MYYRQPRAPTEPELRTIEVAAHLVGVAIEHRQAQEALQKAHDELEMRVEQRTAELRQANTLLQGEIDQRRRAEEALRESEAKYRDVVENANSIILQMDTQGNITFFNRFAQEFFGYSEGEILGRNVVGTIVPATDSTGQDLAAKLQDIVRYPDRYYSSENENMCRDGERVWVAWTNKAVFDKGGRLGEILCIGIDRTEQKRAEEALEQQLKEKAVAAERNRLARDLHDSVTQTLFSASLIAEVLPRLWERHPEEGRRRLEELRELNRGALAEMRTLLLELRPAVLEEAELGDLLRHLAESVIGRARVPVALEVQRECSLSPQVKVALYRIAQEALNNVAKHAAASQATISLNCTDGGIILQVSDDGLGFDPRSVPSKSLGVGIMRERAEAIHATLEIESHIGQGTQVRVVWQDGGHRVVDE